MAWKGDPHAFHDDVGGEIAALNEKASPVVADLVVINDSEDGNSVKKAQAGNLPGVGGGTVYTFSVTGNVSAASGAARLYPPQDVTVTSVRASVGLAPAGASLIVDVNKNGTTIFTTQANRPTIADGGHVSDQETPDVTALTTSDYLTVDVDQIGSTTPGAHLTVIVEVI